MTPILSSSASNAAFFSSLNVTSLHRYSWSATQFLTGVHLNKAANVLAAGLSNGSRLVTGGSPLLTLM